MKPEEQAVPQNPFSRIYETHEWQGGSLSGPGSDPERTHEYREVVARVLRDHAIKSVVDLGSGDWSSSKLVDWTGVDYLGLDVVPVVIDFCRQSYAGPSRRFELFDLTTEELPSADLLICKEVLQHLPNADVHRVVKQLHKFKFALLTNDLRETSHRWYRPRRITSLPPNFDVPAGGYRPLKLNDPPFSIGAREVASYDNRLDHKGWRKQVLLWANPDIIG